jgi:hypothetical protein
MATTTNRRTLLGATAAAPAILAAAPASAATVPASDPEWIALVDEYRVAKAAWDAAVSAYGDAEAEFFRQLPARPERSGTHLIEESMTIAEIKALPLSEAWAKHEAALAAHNAHREDLEHRITGSADAAREAAAERHSEVLDAVKTYRPATMAILVEKIDLLAAAYDGCDEEFAASIFADVRHLAGRA